MNPPPIPNRSRFDVMDAVNQILKLVGICIIIWIAIVVWRGCGDIAEAVTAPPPPKPPDIVTMSEYNRINIGMTYKEAYEIIGANAVEDSRNRIEGVKGVMPSIETVMVSWTNEDGTGMNAIFQNGRIMQKSQFGLD